jgi:DNA-binding MarR family transcriptional regulator
MRTLRQPVCDLRLLQLAVLYGIRHDTLTLGYLAQRMMVTPRVITGIVARLETRGYVRRRDDPVDRRRIRLELTEVGRTVSEAVEREVAASMSAVIAQLDVADLADLNCGLEVLDRVLLRLDSAGVAGDDAH